jgi:omega-6 fatty acid desaturase (delta-12 desaturase)
MKTAGPGNQAPSRAPSWQRTLARHRKPALRSSLWQLANSLIPYFVLWWLMVLALGVSYWITLALAVPAAGFLVRIFIIFHDCGHGSFFRSRRANAFWGFVTGVLTFTPYGQWRHDHAVHHATAGDLDRRGRGDIWTMTVGEYLASSRRRRLAYRFVRNPAVLFLVAPLYLFLIHQRIPSSGAAKRERRSVLWTNATLLAVAVVGFRAYLAIQLTVSMFATAAGVWLFYVQHQFEGVYWERREHWDFVGAALNGSSFYRLPKVLQWFSGNIGFHHVHHLHPGIPNYNLEKCHREDPLFQTVKAVTLWTSRKSLSLRLWDEQEKRLVGYGWLRAARGAGVASSAPNGRA